MIKKYPDLERHATYSVNTKANVLLGTVRTHKKRSLGGGLENHKEVTIKLQKMNRCLTGRHYRMKDPKQWKPCEQKYTRTKGQSKDHHPHVDVTSRYYEVTSNIS